ncbi:DUF3274 domain-containing protein, partial [Massilia sp. TS11]|uniref:effector protein Tle3 domain-containing protein n=1 Tax=Massilia sp. TS11 TaxID=2908003 RepID=UPI001EDB5DEC
VIPDKVLGLFGVQSTPKESEAVWINAPLVPVPALISEDFEKGTAVFDGSDGDAEQQDEFETYLKHSAIRKRVANGGVGMDMGGGGNADERSTEIRKIGKRQVPSTNHGQILTFGSLGKQAHLVETVLAYDLTVGQGYAFGDARYWDYLLKLADWTVSDPYYLTGKMSDPGPCPPGLDTSTVWPSVGP